jgi:hypothetical protein
MKSPKTLDEIYSGDLVEKDGIYICPVCKKEYKRECAAIKHFESRVCFQYKDIYSGTIMEQEFYKMHKKFSAIEGHRGLSIQRFRNSRYYTSIAKLYVFCSNNNINFADYFDYLIHEFRFDPLNSLVAKGCKESQLRLFREEAQEYTNEHKDERFYNANVEWLGEDSTRTLRALERGDISINYLFNKVDYDEFLDKLSRIQFTRLEKIIEFS